MGKWDKVTAKLAPLPIEDLKGQEKIDQLKKELRASTTWTANSLLKEYKLARFGEIDFEHVDEEFKVTVKNLLGTEGLKKLSKEADKKEAAIEQMLEDSYNNGETGWGLYGAGDNTVKAPDGSSFAVQREPMGKVEDPAKFLEWIKSNGYESQLTLPWQRREELVKTALEAGEEPPDGVHAYSRTKFVFRKG